MRAGLHASWRSFRTPLRSPNTPWAAACVFVSLSAALHVLMVGAVLWGEGGRSSVIRARQGVGANEVGVPEEAITTAYFVEDASADAEINTEELASAGKVLQSLHLTIVSTDTSLDAALKDDASDERSAADDEPSVGERQARAALFGRYIGQIEARVERAWMRPRTSIGVDLFECRVLVQQDARRMVLEVTLKECNGDARWQLSLVNAIQAASPLPAPPEPSVFANTIDLHFSSVGYSPDRAEQGYELSTVAALNNTNRSP